MGGLYSVKTVLVVIKNTMASEDRCHEMFNH